MKKTYILLVSAAVAVGVLSFQQSGNFEIEKYSAKNGHKNANGAPTGKTGAPGETNCTSCHAGTSQNGDLENNFILLNSVPAPVTSYIPGATYTATLTMTSDPAKKGFQATVLDATNSMAGTFAAQPTTAISGTARKYANHTSTSNTSTVGTWLWTWTAPATDAGNVTFYVASNKANASNTTSGDVIYLSQHIITSTAGLIEQTQEQANFTAGYSTENNSIAIDFTTLSSGEMNLNLVDMSGRSVFTYNMGNAIVGANKQMVVLPNDIKDGIYVVNFFVNNKAMSAKIMVQK